MTICRKCGKQIPDGQELCSDCQKKVSTSGESHLDGRMQKKKGSGPAASDELNDDAINELLDILSVDNSEADIQEDAEANGQVSRDPEDDSEVAGGSIRTIEPSLFLDNEEGGLFADGSGAEELEDLELPPETLEEPVAEEIPEPEEPVMEDLPEPEEVVMKDLPELEELVTEVLPEPEGPVMEDLPEPEGTVMEGLLEPEEPVMEELPEPEEPAMENLPEPGDVLLEDPLLSEALSMEASPEPEEMADTPEPVPDFAPVESSLPGSIDESVLTMEESQDAQSPQAEDQGIEDFLDVPMPEETAAPGIDASEEDFSDLLSKLDSAEDQPQSKEEELDAVLSGELAMDALMMDGSDMGDMAEDDTVTEQLSGDTTSVDTVFQEALSAVDYTEKEGADNMPEDESPAPLALDEMPETVLEGVGDIPAAEPVQKKKKKREKKQKEPKEAGFFQRIFSNVVTEADAAAEAKEREEEKAAAEAKAAEKEEKKKQAALAKEEKEEQAKADKERKAALKAEKATAKAVEKEEKKRLKAEAAENEVVGKVNPVGATVVMVFFGLICVAAILGSQMLSKSSSVSRAESDFETGDYQDAYESVAGLDVSESSEETVEKVRLCMKLQKQLDSYTNYYKMKMYLEALDALMRGMRNYEANRSKADEYGIISQYNALKDKIVATLSDEFNVSEEQARSILGTENQVDYTAKLEKIIAEWEKKMKEDEK